MMKNGPKNFYKVKMENTFISDFDDFKVSALAKSMSVNEVINSVTIGPNSTLLEITNAESTKIHKKQQSILNKMNISPTLHSNNKSITHSKLLTEIEAEVKDDVETKVRRRLEKIQNASQQLDTQLKSEWTKKQEYLVAQSHQHEETMMKMLEEHDKKLKDHMLKLQQQYRMQLEERNRKNKELKKKEEEERKLLHITGSFHKTQHVFRLEYQEITTILKEYNTPPIILNDPSKHTIVAAVSQKLKQYAEIIEKIKDKCKNKTVTNTELNIATNIVKDVIKLKENMRVLLIRKKEEEAKQEEIRKNLPPVIHPVAEVKQPITASTVTTVSNDTLDSASSSVSQSQLNTSNEKLVSFTDTFTNRNSLKTCAILLKYLENYKNSFAQLLADPRTKEFRFHCQKAVNLPLNAISAINVSHLMDKFQKLSNLLRGINVEAGGSTVSTTQHPQGIEFCTDLLARKFVQQGDLLISSNTDSAHCYAAVLIALWHDFPDFGKLVLAYFYQSAPYLVPLYPPNVKGQSEQDYYISLGYNYNDNGTIEKQDKFLKRMSGIMRLYAAVTVSKLKKEQRGPHPHGLMYAWRWITSILNIEPRPDITAQLIFDFLEVTGSSMEAAYGNQFKKILVFINDVYLEKMRKMDSGGPVTRLEVLLNKIKANGQLEPSKGKLPEDFCPLKYPNSFPRKTFAR